ncbi:hypothetical protein HZS_1678 [Henneguya salminicola]|nr:hypothetical protein HZS_1678 [Henneguya salminicola]
MRYFFICYCQTQLAYFSHPLLREISRYKFIPIIRLNYPKMFFYQPNAMKQYLSFLIETLLQGNHWYWVISSSPNFPLNTFCLETFYLFGIFRMFELTQKKSLVFY